MQEQLRRVLATISNVESRLDSTSFDAAVKQIQRIQQQLDDRITLIGK
jgi:hypothetical protein